MQYLFGARVSLPGLFPGWYLQSPQDGVGPISFWTKQRWQHLQAQDWGWKRLWSPELPQERRTECFQNVLMHPPGRRYSLLLSPSRASSARQWSRKAGWSHGLALSLPLPTTAQTFRGYKSKEHRPQEKFSQHLQITKARVFFAQNLVLRIRQQELLLNASAPADHCHLMPTPSIQCLPLPLQQAPGSH